MFEKQLRISDYDSVHSFWRHLTTRNKWYIEVAPSHVVDLKPHLELVAPLVAESTNRIREEMDFTFNEYWDVINWDNVAIDSNLTSLLKQYCSFCKHEVRLMHRYPKSLCTTCVKNVHCLKGRKVEFFNVDLSGGCEGFFRGTKKRERYHSDECYIGNKVFMAQEHKLGGVVIQLKS